MDEALQKALDMLDKSAALIQELVAQLQSKSDEKDITKKAESLAVKTGISFSRASDMIKEAEAKGSGSDSLMAAADMLTRESPFGKVANFESNVQKTDSKAKDNFLEKEAELLAEFGL